MNNLPLVLENREILSNYLDAAETLIKETDTLVLGMSSESCTFFLLLPDHSFATANPELVSSNLRAEGLIAAEKRDHVALMRMNTNKVKTQSIALELKGFLNGSVETWRRVATVMASKEFEIAYNKGDYKTMSKIVCAEIVSAFAAACAIKAGKSAPDLLRRLNGAVYEFIEVHFFVPHTRLD